MTLIRPLPSIEDDLTVAERARFNSRFETIHQWCRSLQHCSPAFNLWIKSNDHLDSDFFIDMFESGLSVDLKRLLAREAAPTLNDILSLGWVKKGAIGSYCKIAVSEKPDEYPTIMYVGFSAATGGSTNAFGTTSRKKAHQRDWKKDNVGGSFAKMTRDDRDKYKLKFVSLWIGVDDRTDLDDESSYISLVGAHYSEFVLSKWLGAFRSTSPMSISANPWQAASLEWIGSVTTNPLQEGWADVEKKVSYSSSPEYHRGYKQGKHLEGKMSKEEIKVWVRAFRDRQNAAPYNANKRVSDMTEEEHEALLARRRAQQKKRTEQPGWLDARNAKERKKTAEDRAKGIPPPDRTARYLPGGSRYKGYD